MTDKKKTVIVTGGAGFLGSFLCERLLKDSRVICLDNFTTSPQSNINHLLKNPDFEFVNADITEPLELDQLPELERFKIRIHGVQGIYNLACPNTHDDFNRLRHKTLLANSLGLKNVLDLAVKYQAKFFQASTSVVYGQVPNNGQELHEENIGLIDHLDPRGCYDEGKRFAETMCVTYRDVFGLEVHIGRLFWVYGPRQTLRDGHLVQDFIMKAVEGGDLTIYGDEETWAAMLYVTDAIDAIIRLMESDCPGPVNIGSNQVIKLVELGETIIKMVGNDQATIEFRSPPKTASLKALPNLDKIKGIGWTPIVTLNEGLKKTMEYVIAQKDIIGPYFG
ncbi:NAD-dependent epimerase/dehydratase family protein [Patescibacteria group bacterium]|nr:NAD-dependent epimerase/dehydratase family protein [Patescibacteria group bacterium]MBU1028808.1 NAD-dependent epimerase/dehydratase family protein [Patescibacteria group bacterium]